MTWRIRHQGSPRAVEGLTLEDVVEGLQDGLWEATDEVMGPLDRDWVALENHPQFADIALDLEPHPPRQYDDETHLDFNPLIDVCLVLLIFFILTTSYAALQKVLDMPGMSAKNVKSAPRKRSDVEQTTIKVVANKEKGETIFRIEDEVIAAKALASTLTRYVSKTKKTEILFDAKDVEWGSVVAVQDAARAAKVNRVNFLK